MELQAVHRPLPVLNSHNDTFLCLSRHHERGGQRFRVCHQGMVPGSGERGGNVLEQPLLPVMDGRRFPVNPLIRMDDSAAESLANGLMAQANPQNRDGGAQCDDCFH